MNRQRLRFYGTLAACCLGCAIIGGLLGWALVPYPGTATLMLVLVAVTGGMVWLRWR